MNSKIIVCGDVHGKWWLLNILIATEKPDIILQCGDYGWWPHIPDVDNTPLDYKETAIYWCPGNHENWDDLDERGTDITLMPDGSFYCPFGTTKVLPTGERVLFVGGAESIDKWHRIQGYSWWPQEIITEKEMLRLPDIDIDIVISHTIPTRFIKEFGYMRYRDKYNDPSCKALDIVFDIYKPKKWYSGHYHHRESNEIEGCKWEALADAKLAENGKDFWWTYL